MVSELADNTDMRDEESKWILGEELLVRVVDIYMTVSL